jgi:hypothetical protein
MAQLSQRSVPKHPPCAFLQFDMMGATAFSGTYTRQHVMDFTSFMRWQSDYDSPSVGILDGSIVREAVRLGMNRILGKQQHVAGRPLLCEASSPHLKDGHTYYEISPQCSNVSQHEQVAPAQPAQAGVQCVENSQASSILYIEEGSMRRSQSPSPGNQHMSRLQRHANSLRRLRQLEGS